MNTELENNNDKTANELSDVTLEIKVNNLNEVCSQWESKILSIDLSSIDVTSAFSPLTNVGVGTSYIPSLKTALDKAESLVLSVSKTIKESLSDQEDVDDKYKNENRNRNNRSGNSNRNSNSNSSSNSNNNSNNAAMNSEVDNKTKNIEINKNFVDKVNSLEDEKYIQLMTALGAISNGNLLQYLVDENYATELKKIVLASQNIDQELRQMILEMDENELQVTLQSIFTDNNLISDASKNIIYTYTENLANKSNVDMIKVTKTAQFYNNVDDILSTVNELKNKEDLQKNVSDVYDGDVSKDVSSESIEFVRTAVEEIAKNNNISAEEILSDSSKADILKNELSTLTKDLSFFRTVNTMGSEARELIFNSIVKKES